MKITNQKLARFKTLYKKYFGKNISDKDATDQIRALLVITQLGIKDIPP